MKLGLGTSRGLMAAAATAFVISGTAAQAGDGKWDWDVSFGVTVTSDYASRGATNTDGGAAIQPFAELTVHDLVYLGYWGSNVSYGGTKDWENDLSVGIRPTLGPLDFDFGYVRYIYSDNTVAAFGEVYAKASYSPVEPLTLGVAAYFNPDNSDHYIEGNASYDLPHNFSISGAVGTNSVSGTTSTPFNIGVGWAPQDWVSFDARYHNGPSYSKFVVSATFSSSLKALGVLP